MNSEKTEYDSLNIVILLLDCVRAQNLPFYGNSLNTMPNLMKMIEEFTVFPSAISSNNWTLPSVASTFTGTYLSKHGLVFDGDVLTSELSVLPEYLQKKGYQTLLFSSHPYLSGFSGLDRGFSKVFDKTPLNGFKLYEFVHRTLQSVTSRFIKKKSAENTQNDRTEKTIRSKGRVSKMHLFLRWHMTYFSDRDAKYKLKQFVKWFRKSRDADRGYFAFMHLFEAHTPYIIPAKYRKRFINKNSRNKRLWAVRQGIAYPRAYGLTEEEFEANKSMYNGAILYLDRILHKMVKFLKKTDTWSNTLFLILSDHGENLGEYGLMFHKFVLYDTLIKIPLIIKFPAGTQANKHQQIVQNVDIFPTIVDITNGQDEHLLSQFMGNSLVSENIKNREYGLAIAELLKPWQNPPSSPESLPQELKKYWGRYILACRTHAFKYIHSSTGDHEYYDLMRDPGERKNIIDKINTDDLDAVRMKIKPYWELLSQQAALLRDRLTGVKKEEMSDSQELIAKKLKDLGYL